jgi:hypothetical protein
MVLEQDEKEGEYPTYNKREGSLVGLVATAFQNTLLKER